MKPVILLAWYFSFVSLSGMPSTLVHGPFVSQEQCEIARDDVEGLTSDCWEGA